MEVRTNPVKRVWSTGTPSLEWMLRTALNSLKSNLSDNPPTLNQVECLLYLSRIHLEEADRRENMAANVVGLHEEYKRLRKLAHERCPEIKEYGIH